MFDPKKPCRTKDGQDVTIYCTDAPGRYPIHGRVGDSEPVCWKADGTWRNSTSCPTAPGINLVNIPETRTDVKPFKVGDLVRTRDGRPARIYAVDCGGAYPIHGAFRMEDGEWLMQKWTDDGCFFEFNNGPYGADLIRVPETRTVAVRVYLMKDGGINALPAALKPDISGVFGSQKVELTFEEGRHG